MTECPHEWEQVWLEWRDGEMHLTGGFRCRHCRALRDAPQSAASVDPHVEVPGTRDKSSSVDLSSLRGLVETWRAEADELDKATGGEWIEPEVRRDCADQLSAVLSRIQLQENEEVTRVEPPVVAQERSDLPRSPQPDSSRRQQRAEECRADDEYFRSGTRYPGQ